MKYLGVLAALLLCTGSASAETESLLLQFSANRPIVQTSEITVDIEQDLETGKAHSRTKQIIESELTVLDDNLMGTSAIETAPLQLQVILKRLSVGVELDEDAISYDTKNPDVATPGPVVAAMRHALNQPLVLRYDENFASQEPVTELQQLLSDLPTLSEYFPTKTLPELYGHLFMVAGKSLVVGQHLKQTVSVGQLEGLTLPVDLEITSANFKEVGASLNGKLEEQTLNLGGENGQAPVEVLLSGKVSGRASWTRNHGLLASYTVHHFYDGRMRSGGEEWPIRMTITHRVDSNRKS